MDAPVNLSYGNHNMKTLHFALFTFTRYIRIVVSSAISFFVLLFNGVKFQFPLIFDGVPLVVNQPGDTAISIGRRCKFSSSPNSNLIGINRKCVLSTHMNRGRISIGNQCGFSATSIAAFDSITIGDRVRVGANTVITDSDWHPEDPRVGPAKPIVIEDDVWLGYGVIVLKGVTIGKNALVGAGSVVVTDIPANSVAAGNPCKVIVQTKNS